MIAEVGDMLKVSRHAVCAAKARQHANHDAKHDAEQHHQQVERLKDDGEAVKQIGNFFHR